MAPALRMRMLVVPLATFLLLIPCTDSTSETNGAAEAASADDESLLSDNSPLAEQVLPDASPSAGESIPATVALSMVAVSAATQSTLSAFPTEATQSAIAAVSAEATLVVVQASISKSTPAAEPSDGGTTAENEVDSAISKHTTGSNPSTANDAALSDGGAPESSAAATAEGKTDVPTDVSPTAAAATTTKVPADASNTEAAATTTDVPADASHTAAAAADTITDVPVNVWLTAAAETSGNTQDRSISSHPPLVGAQLFRAPGSVLWFRRGAAARTTTATTRPLAAAICTAVLVVGSWP